MSKKKPTLVDIKKSLDKSPEKSKIKPINIANPRSKENPQRGNRGDFKRLSLTLPKEMLDSLRTIGLKRRVNEKPNYELTAIVREALARFIETEEINSP